MGLVSLKEGPAPFEEPPLHYSGLSVRSAWFSYRTFSFCLRMEAPLVELYLLLSLHPEGFWSKKYEGPRLALPFP